MILRQLYIQNFGKFHRSSIVLEEGINLIEGRNESGKSTIRTFITAMLFGMPRLRGRAAKSDRYSRYDPWEGAGGYNGLLRFESGGKLFRIERDFRKETRKEELVCEADGERLSIADGDLQMLLGHVSAAVFESGFSMEQLKNASHTDLIRALQNVMADYAGSGSDQLNVGQAIDRLKKKKRELERKRDTDFQRSERKLYELHAQEMLLQEELTHLGKEEHPLREEKASGKFLKIRRKCEMGAVLTVVCLLLACIPATSRVGVVFRLLLPLFLAVDVFHFVKLHEIMERKKEQDVQLKWENQRQRQWRWERARQSERLHMEQEEIRRQMQKAHPLDIEIEALELAITKIQELLESRYHRIGNKLRRRTEEILSVITDGKYNRIHITPQFSIQIDTGVNMVTPEQLSEGTAQQIYFAFRMAAGEILCEDEQLPFMLDDVFALYDDERLGKILQWLHQSGHQVLLFTCQQREGILLEKLGIPYHKINLESAAL